MNPSGENKKPNDFEEMCDLFPDEDPSLLRAVLDNSGSIQGTIENIFKLKVPRSEDNKHQEKMKSFEEEIGEYDSRDVDKIVVSLEHDMENESCRSLEISTAVCNNKESANNRTNHLEHYECINGTKKNELPHKRSRMYQQFNLSDTERLQLYNEQTSTYDFTERDPSAIVEEGNFSYVEASTSAASVTHNEKPYTSKTYTDSVQMKEAPESLINSVGQIAQEEELPLSKMLGIVIKNNEDDKPTKNRFGTFSSKLKEKKVQDKNNDPLETNIKSNFHQNTEKAGQTTKDMSQEYILNRFFFSEPKVESKEHISTVTVAKEALDGISDRKKQMIATVNDLPIIERSPTESAVTCTPFSFGLYHLSVKAAVIKNLPVEDYLAIPMAQCLKKGCNTVSDCFESSTSGDELTNASYENLNKSLVKNRAEKNLGTKWDEDIPKELSKDQFELQNEKTASESENNVENDLYYSVLFDTSNISSEEGSDNLTLLINDFPVEYSDPAKILFSTEYRPSASLKISQNNKNDVIEQQVRLSKINFPNMDENLIQSKINACQGDSEKFQDLIDLEKRKLAKARRNEQLFREELNLFLQKVFHLDPDSWKAKRSELVGDHANQNDFITTGLLLNKKQADLNEILRTKFPSLSEAQLREKSALFSNDEVGLKLFIAEETERQELENSISAVKAEGNRCG